MTIFGWDSSDYDHSRGPMNMAAAAADGISFYTHKATEGASVVHHPGASLAAARDAGIPFLGVYMVPRSGPSVAAQVDYLLSWMASQAPWWSSFPGWFWQMDTEHWPYDAVSAQRGHDCAVLLAQRTGKRVLHYAPEWAYGSSIPAGEPLWASAYAAGSGRYRNIYPGDSASNWHTYSGRMPSVLQFTSSATIGGQTGCDANAFRGTTADFAALIGATSPLATGGFMAALSDLEQRELYVWVASMVDPNTPPGGRPDDPFHFPPQLVRIKAAQDALSTKLDGIIAHLAGDDSTLAQIAATANATLAAAQAVGAPTDEQVAAQTAALSEVLRQLALSPELHDRTVADMQAALNSLHAG